MIICECTMTVRKANEKRMAKEEDVFTEVLGDYPAIRVLGYLIVGKYFDYSISDIAEGANVGWTTIHGILPRLEKLGIVKQTRTVGMAKLYKINPSNPYAAQIIILFENLLKASVGEVIARQKKKMRA